MSQHASGIAQPMVALLLAAVLLGAVAGQDLCGDCNEDQRLDVLDVLAAAQHSAGIAPLSGRAHRLCDVDQSGAVSVIDALQIAQKTLGLPTAIACAPMPRSWLEHTMPGTRPGPHHNHTLAYRVANASVVLFGGLNSTAAAMFRNSSRIGCIIGEWKA